MEYEVIIIGAGPAGLMAGYVLSQTGINFLILEKGKKYNNRDKNCPYDVSYGFGGAGLFSDGKLSFAPSASKLWTKLEKEKLEKAYKYLRTFFSETDILIDEWNPAWTTECKYESIKDYKSLYLSEKARYKILDKVNKKVEDKIKINEEVKSIIKEGGKYVIECAGGAQYKATVVILATGKGADLKLVGDNIEFDSGFCAEMGIRIEVEKSAFIPNKEKQIDYKVIERIDDSTEIRTFCCCKNGVVRKSLFDNRITYNGESTEGDSQYSNIGIMIRTNDPNSIYAAEMGRCLERRETFECSFEELIGKEYIIGVETDKKIFELVHKIIANTYRGKVYGPEIEKYGKYPKLSDTLSFSKNFYCIGDATGSFRGLMAAFVSGIYVSHILSDNKHYNMKNYMHQFNIKQSSTEEMKLIFTAQSKAFFYCRDVICQYVLEQGLLPINPFRVFDYFLGDRVDRDLVRRGNNQLIKKCDELWVFGQIADGVLFEIACAIEQGKKIRFFSIGTKVEEIKEISVEQITFEPEVHARQIRKSDLIKFIKKESKKEENEQLWLFDFMK